MTTQIIGTSSVDISRRFTAILYACPRSSASTPGKAQSSSAQADQLRLSPEARALKAVADKAAEPPAIRQDVVDRARALLDADTLGDDPAQLADAIIDDLLTFQ